MAFLSFTRLCVRAFCLFALCLSGPLSAAAYQDKTSEKSSDKVTLYGTAWGMTLLQNGKGFYNDVLFALISEAGDIDYKPLPQKRAIADFKDDKNSCLYPASESQLTDYHKITGPFTSGPVMVQAKAFLFSAKGQPIASSPDQLRGKTLAYPSASPIADLWAHYGIKFIGVHDETSKARMVLSGRVNYITGTLPDIQLVFNSLKRPLPPYDKLKPLMQTDLTIICYQTPKTQALITALMGLYDNGGKERINTVNKAKNIPLLP